MPTGHAPLTQRIDEPVASVATAASLTSIIGRAQFAGVLTVCKYAPNADITGVNTNTRRVDLVNKGQDGNGSTVMASLQFDAGVNASDYDEKDITLSGTPANLNVAEGDILVWVSAAVGAGLADPGGHVHVELSRD